jgi:hypothetical protein
MCLYGLDYAVLARDIERRTRDLPKTETVAPKEPWAMPGILAPVIRAIRGLLGRPEPERVAAD